VTDFFRDKWHTRLGIQVVTCMIGKNNRDVHGSAISQGEPAAQKRVVHMDNIHCLKKFFVAGLIAQGEVKAGVRESQTGVADDAQFVVLIVEITKCEHIHFVPRIFKGTFVQIDIICDTADVRFISICHHADFHCSIVRVEGFAVKTRNGRMTHQGEKLVKLILRDKEYEVKGGMNLLSALKKCNIVPESVIATRGGEMILDDELLKDGEVIKLVAVISGGARNTPRNDGTGGYYEMS
jgi:sulfur carrier protein ThiS